MFRLSQAKVALLFTGRGMLVCAGHCAGGGGQVFEAKSLSFHE